MAENQQVKTNLAPIAWPATPTERIRFCAEVNRSLLTVGQSGGAADSFLEGQFAGYQAALAILDSPDRLLEWEIAMRDQRAGPAYVGTISLEEADRIADMALGKAPLPEGARRWTMAIEPTPRGLELQARTVEEAPDLGWPSAGHAGECPHCGAEKGIWIDLQRTPSVCTHCGNRSDRELEFPVSAEALSPASRPRPPGSSLTHGGRGGSGGS